MARSPASTSVDRSTRRPSPAGRRLIRTSENILLVIPLVAMLLLPVVEILLRTLFKTGISG